MELTFARVALIVAVVTVIWLATALARWWIARRRQGVLASAAAFAPVPAASETEATTQQKRDGGVRILAFSSAGCVQCHRQQTPALARVQTLRPGVVEVIEVDAPAAPELTERYRILTVPSTVVLDATGTARSLNYGFVPSDRLLAQVDDALAVAQV